MKKAILLGGAARIVREPSREEMQIAMLRRMGAGHILDMEIPKVEAERRAAPAKPPKSELDLAMERETGWIRDQIGRDIAALDGSGPILLDVRQEWREWRVDMLQWRTNGMGAKVEHALKFERRNYSDPFDEGKLRRMVTIRLAKTLARQAELVRQWGPPRLLEPHEVDLSRFMIDKPLAALLDAQYDDAGIRMRQALAKGDGLAFGGYARDKVRADLSFGREAVKGQFEVVDQGITLSWSKGGLSVFGAPIPETLIMGSAGHPLGHLLDHPLFDGSMRITAVHPVRHSGVDGYALTLKNAVGPMPAHW